MDKRVFAILIGWFFLSGCSPPADDFDQAAKATRQGDYPAEHRVLGRAAERGDSQAQFLLGLRYSRGVGVPMDEAEAVRWYRRAAEQGHSGAQLQLGASYADGRGVTRDEAEAMRWYNLAAEQGDLEALFRIGVMYAEGRGVPRDDAQAIHRYLRAAQQGHVKAAHNLGSMYEQGRGGSGNLVSAYKWTIVAAAQDLEALHDPDKPRGEEALRRLWNLEREMTKQQIDNAKRLAAWRLVVVQRLMDER